MVTIDDVAQEAGVSRSTVSYALSGKRPISEETRDRINRAISSLGYRPHAGARALASARTGIIGLMAPLRAGVDVNVVMQFVTGVVEAGRDHGYDILMVTQDEGVVERVTGSSMVDALVVMDIETHDPRIPLLASFRQPTVLIGLPADPEGLSCVDLDFAQAGSRAVRHLVGLGHRVIGLIGSPQDVVARGSSYAERTTSGFVGACRAAGASHVEIPTAASAAGAQEAINRLLDVQPETTALVVHNEIALPHVMAALRARGRTIPDDVSIIAICPESTAVAQSPQVTSINLPAADVGRTAVEMVLAVLDRGSVPQVRLLSPAVTERATTARAR